MEDEAQPSKPRLEFKRGRAASKPPARKPGQVEDALSRMAGRVAERRRAQDEARGSERPDAF